MEFIYIFLGVFAFIAGMILVLMSGFKFLEWIVEQNFFVGVLSLSIAISLVVAIAVYCLERETESKVKVEVIEVYEGPTYE